MTELTSDEQASLDAPFHDALIAFTGAIGEALEDICSYSLTFGDAYVPFKPDPDDDCTDSEACNQAWVRVITITPKPSTADQGWDGECGLVLQADLEVGVLRCFEIPEEGEAPTSTDVMAAALQSLTDMSLIHRVAMATEVWDSITTGSWTPDGLLGGQYGGIWTFTVDIEGGCLVSGNESV